MKTKTACATIYTEPLYIDTVMISGYTADVKILFCPFWNLDKSVSYTYMHVRESIYLIMVTDPVGCSVPRLYEKLHYAYKTLSNRDVPSVV